jgi:hypothetical protein
MILQPFFVEVDVAQLSSRIVRLQPQAGERAHNHVGSLFSHRTNWEVDLLPRIPHKLKCLLH